MAIFKLGAMVTDIVGSIGGTTFRRGSQNSAVYNKSNGASRSLLKKNLQLGPIAKIFRQWRELSPEIKSTWTAAALLYQFPDKFGVLKNLTARQLFTKLNIQLLVVNSSVLQGDDIDNNTAIIEIQNFDIDSNLASAELQIGVLSFASWVLVQIEVSKNKLFAPTFTRRKVSAFMWVENGGGFDIINQLIAQYPYIDNTYNVRAFVTPMNYYGFKGATVYQDGTWTT